MSEDKRILDILDSDDENPEVPYEEQCNLCENRRVDPSPYCTTCSKSIVARHSINDPNTIVRPMVEKSSGEPSRDEIFARARRSYF